MMMKNKRLAFVLTVLLPLVSGAAVYFLFRAKKPAVLEFGQAIELHTDSAWGWLAGSLPSFFWSFSLASALIWVWSKMGAKGIWLSGAMAMVVCWIFENLQASQLLAGTFDWKDIWFSWAACLLAMLIHRYCIQHETFH